MDAIGLMQSVISFGQRQILYAGESNTVPQDATLCMIIINSAKMGQSPPVQFAIILTEGCSATVPIGDNDDEYIKFQWNGSGVSATPGDIVSRTYWEYVWMK